MIHPVCPYCSTALTGEDAGARYCADCGTAHHNECWDENGGCTVFGCASAPPEEPKLQVAQADLDALPAAPPPPFPDAAPPPPPPHFNPVTNFTLGGYVGSAPTMPRDLARGPHAAIPKSRATYVVLGVVFGAFGLHNFYAGYSGRGAAQLAITICTLFFGGIISWIWAIIEVCTVDRDSRDIVML